MEEDGIIPDRVILLVSSDLQARVRLEAATAPLGFEVVAQRPESELRGTPPATVVLDLDQLGADGVLRWAGLIGGASRVLGFFSHTNRELGEAAAGAGIETIRRGRFWKELPERLGRASD